MITFTPHGIEQIGTRREIAINCADTNIRAHCNLLMTEHVAWILLGHFQRSQHDALAGFFGLALAKRTASAGEIFTMRLSEDTGKVPNTLQHCREPKGGGGSAP